MRSEQVSNKETTFLPGYRQHLKRKTVQRCEQGKPYEFSEKVDKQSKLTARKTKHSEGKGRWKKQKSLVMQGIGVQTLPHTERWQTFIRSQRNKHSNGIEPR